jgi:flagellar biosynthesis/type III secretory pathway protein FliH
MSEEFVRLADYLRTEGNSVEVVAQSPEPACEHSSKPTETDEALRAARIFRAALSEALDVALRDLLVRIGRDVLARELQLAPADVGAIVRAARGRSRDGEVLAVRVHPAELDALASCEIATVPDASLARGDVVLELRSGTIDVSLPARLEAAVLGVCS